MLRASFTPNYNSNTHSHFWRQQAEGDGLGYMGKTDGGGGGGGGGGNAKKKIYPIVRGRTVSWLDCTTRRWSSRSAPEKSKTAVKHAVLMSKSQLDNCQTKLHFKWQTTVPAADKACFLFVVVVCVCVCACVRTCVRACVCVRVCTCACAQNSNKTIWTESLTV